MPGQSVELIRLSDVTKTYISGDIPFHALRDVSLSVDSGEFVAIVGPSGSGKSTLLNVIAGIDRPTNGSVVVDGTEISGLSENDAARWRGRSVGVVFQFFQLLPTISLLDNVMLPMDFCGVHDRRERARIAAELLERVGLEDQAHKLPSGISGGQAQRAAIARALANDAPLILGDEPTGNLDSEAASSMMDLFDELVRLGRTIVMVTHDKSLAQRTHRTVTVKDGVVSESDEISL